MLSSRVSTARALVARVPGGSIAHLPFELRRPEQRLKRDAPTVGALATQQLSFTSATFLPALSREA